MKKILLILSAILYVFTGGECFSQVKIVINTGLPSDIKLIKIDVATTTTPIATNTIASYLPQIQPQE